MTDRTQKLLTELLNLSSSQGEANDKLPVTSTSIVFGLLPDKDDQVFEQCLSALRDQDELGHLSHEEIKKSLWDLYLNVAINAHLYLDSEKRDERVAEFWSHISMKATEHEVMFAIENLSLSDDKVPTLNQVQFRALREEEFDTRADRTELG